MTAAVLSFPRTVPARRTRPGAREATRYADKALNRTTALLQREVEQKIYDAFKAEAAFEKWVREDMANDLIADLRRAS